MNEEWDWQVVGFCCIGLFASLQTTCDACKPNLMHVSCLVKLKLFWLAIVCIFIAFKEGRELKEAGSLMVCTWPSQTPTASIRQCFALKIFSQFSWSSDLKHALIDCKDSWSKGMGAI